MCLGGSGGGANMTKMGIYHTPISSEVNPSRRHRYKQRIHRKFVPKMRKNQRSGRKIAGLLSELLICETNLDFTLKTLRDNFFQPLMITYIAYECD